jgi:hypothetical protein
VTGRRSYRGLMGLPAWGVYDSGNRLVATIRAASAYDARALFHRHGIQVADGRVRRVESEGRP